MNRNTKPLVIILNFRIASISLTDGTERVYGPYTQMSSDLDVINLKTINFRVGDTLPFTQVVHF